MKKFYILVFILIMCLPLSACGKPGDTSNVTIDLGRSEKFSEDEIESAVNCVIDNFNFSGCELTDIWFDETNNEIQTEGYMNHGHGSTNGIDENNVIVLYSNFDVDSKGDGVLTPNSTYSNWLWILVRDSNTGDWKIDDWGY